LASHGLRLTWSNPSSGAPIVRDVTSESGPSYDPSGPALTATPTASCPVSTCLYDESFTNTAARTYAIWATDDGTAATASPSATVQTFGPFAALPTALTLAVSATHVTYNHSVTLTGKATRGGLPFGGAPVKVLSTVLGSTPAVLTSLTTATDGTVRFSYVPIRSRTYQLVFDGDAFSTGSVSYRRTVWLAPRVVVRFSPSIVQWKQASAFKGVVAPAFPGQTVLVQRWTGSAWSTTGRATLSSTSTFALTLRLPIGRHTYRALLPAVTNHSLGVSAGSSLLVTARTLVQGNSGPDVLAMEKRLTTLRYDVGRVDGVFDYDTRHAATAFQKVEGLVRTGKWSNTERLRALRPHGFRLRYSDDRLTAEVDLTRQVLVLARSGVIQTIVDISSGSEQVYYQDGVKNIAHTPRGVFSIYHKINGIRVSKLGELYKPSYFYKGYAIHGSASVPVYPASHGCVRITNPVADRLFARLAIGTRVAVYDS
ncbi:MAG: L,D-transpeptidase family protein, partial [Actinomycetota bacterium]|nr:L,D-transpeptidase family protein [Actinomycetota bacterium]